MTSKKILYIVVLGLIAVAAYAAYQGAFQPAAVQNGDDITVASGEGAEESDNQVDNNDTEIQSRGEDAEETATDQVTQDFDYEDGDYEAEATYTVPNGTQYALELALTLEQDVVTDVQVFFDDQGAGQTSTELQEAFYNNYTDEVVGKDLSDIDLSRVGGASLTTEAFNQALGDIRTQAS